MKIKVRLKGDVTCGSKQYKAGVVEMDESNAHPLLIAGTAVPYVEPKAEPAGDRPVEAKPRKADA